MNKDKTHKTIPPPPTKLSSLLSDLKTRTGLSMTFSKYKYSNLSHQSSIPVQYNTVNIPSIVISNMEEHNCLNISSDRKQQNVSVMKFKPESHDVHRRLSVGTNPSYMDLRTQNNDYTDSNKDLSSTCSLPSLSEKPYYTKLKFERSQSFSMETGHLQRNPLLSRTPGFQNKIYQQHSTSYSSQQQLLDTVIINKPPANLIKQKTDIFIGQFSVTFEELNELFLVKDTYTFLYILLYR
jgi:hypothetical protein